MTFIKLMALWESFFFLNLKKSKWIETTEVIQSTFHHHNRLELKISTGRYLSHPKYLGGFLHIHFMVIHTTKGTDRTKRKGHSLSNCTKPKLSALHKQQAMASTCFQLLHVSWPPRDAEWKLACGNHLRPGWHFCCFRYSVCSLEATSNSRPPTALPARLLCKGSYHVLCLACFA